MLGRLSTCGGLLSAPSDNIGRGLQSAGSQPARRLTTCPTCCGVSLYFAQGARYLAVSLGTTGVTLRTSSEVAGSDRRTALVLDQNRALDLLRPCQSDLRIIKELRTLLATPPGSPPVSDREVLTEIARKIEARELLAFRTDSRPLKKGGGVIQPQDDEDNAPPPAPRRSGPSAPPPEAPSLAANTDAAAQAATARQAAQDGVPFCEH